MRLSLKPLKSGWNDIQIVINKTSAPGMANTIVRFHLLNAPAIACEMGISPVLDNINKAIIRPNISLGVRVCIQVIKRTAKKPLPRSSENNNPETTQV